MDTMDIYGNKKKADKFEKDDPFGSDDDND
jgi:hypothetical protein